MSSGMALLSMLGTGQARAFEARTKRQRNAATADAILEGKGKDERGDGRQRQPRMGADEHGWGDGDGWRNRG
jgi:hypothetical protein